MEIDEVIADRGADVPQQNTAGNYEERRTSTHESNEQCLNSDAEVDPVDDIVDFLVRNVNISFKSQQIGDKDLSTSEKKLICLDLYKKGLMPFLIKFGGFLTLKQLSFFDSLDVRQTNPELANLLTQLKRVASKRKIIIKNRRYEALSKMLKEDSYFKETEMMQRNPLLYEHLVGQYMTENEKKARDNIDTQNITFLNVLIEGMDRERYKTTLIDQRCEENRQMNGESSEEENYVEPSNENSDEEARQLNWGEFSGTKKNVKNKPKIPKPQHLKQTFVTSSERALLREEFVQEMYRSFLAGEDEDFDYCSVDNNADYDCTDVNTRDEEEKYFDSETPEDTTEPMHETENSSQQKTSSDENQSANLIDDTNEESEDELDVYMRHLNQHPAIVNLNKK